MSTLSTEKREWLKFYQDTPFAPPQSQRDRDALKPGTCVESVDHHGRVHKNDDDGCIVIGHGWDNTEAEKFVWQGSKYEFDATWRID